MKILITDVTEMHQGNFCVAGWSLTNQAMVRPLPNGSNWTAPLLTAYKVMPAVTIEIHATNATISGTYPHKTEDMPIDASKITFVSPGPINWWGTTAPVTASTISDAFGGKLISPNQWEGAYTGNYVAEGTHIRSLAAVKVLTGRLEFYERDYKGTKSLGAYLNNRWSGLLCVRHL
jgi:hypothetical protein